MNSIKQFIFIILLGIGISSCKKDEVQTAPQPVAKDYHQSAETKFVNADGVKYAYRELGEKTGIPIVMISSLGSSMDDWDPAITNGLAQKYKVILLDIPGVGRSSGKTPNTITDMGKRVADFIQALGLSRINLLGFSMGSFISQQIALTKPDLVNKIILTGTGPKGAVGLSNLPNLLAASANLSAEDSFLKFGFTSSAKSIKAGRLAYERVQKRKADRDLPVSKESAGAQVQAVLDWAQPAPNALNELTSISQPVLIVQGEADIPVPVENAINMSRNIPHTRLIVYPDAGHAAIFQYPDLFVQEALDFLTESAK